jgi:hypothetical protein
MVPNPIDGCEIGYVESRVADTIRIRVFVGLLDRSVRGMEYGSGFFLSLSKKRKKIHDSYCFVTFLSLKNDASEENFVIKASIKIDEICSENLENFIY